MWKCIKCGHVFKSGINVDLTRRCPKCKERFPERYDPLEEEYNIDKSLQNRRNDL